VLTDQLLNTAQTLLTGLITLLPEGALDLNPLTNVTQQMSHGVHVLFDAAVLGPLVALLIVLATAGWTFRIIIWVYKKIPIVGGH